MESSEELLLIIRGADELISNYMEWFQQLWERSEAIIKSEVIKAMAKGRASSR